MGKIIMQPREFNLREVLSKFENCNVTIEAIVTIEAFEPFKMSIVVEKFDWMLDDLKVELFDMFNEGNKVEEYICKLQAIELIDDDFICLRLKDGVKINIVKS
jgi:hypothetical protein